MRIEGTPSSGTPAASATPASGATCPQCGADKTGMFCEVCGFDYASGTSTTNAAAAAATTPPPAAEQATSQAWTAVVTADRDYFDSVIAASSPDAASIEFPGYCPERRFTLTGKEMRIGRRSASRGLDPEIDLTGPPTDPGISHLHAVLMSQPDGSWSVLDPGSSNGTQVNGTDMITGVPVPLHSGDRVSLGAWTVLTIQSA
ncbi:MAG TPA: FHA domain-containing protein [Streptosporangiaceae bacterium]|nr:FHA domain-containing protein [Streptosporangiaceae bacterium]